MERSKGNVQPERQSEACRTRTTRTKETSGLWSCAPFEMTTLFLDIENVDDRLICIGWAVDDGPVLVHPMVSGDLTLLLSDPNVVKVSHSTHDAKNLRWFGTEVVGPFHDTQVMAYRLNENTPLTLEYTVKRYVHHEMDKRIRTSAGEPVFRCDDGREVHLRDAPYGEVEKYNRADVEELRHLYGNLKKRLIDSMWWDFFLEEDVPFTEELLDVMGRGMPLNITESEKFRVELEAAAERAGSGLLRSADLPEAFNLNSGPQLSGYLFRKVFEFSDSLTYDVETCEAIKSCLTGEHEDCAEAWWNPMEGFEPSVENTQLPVTLHCKDLLPEGFELEKVGRTLVHGKWMRAGLGLKPGILTPSGDRPSTSSPALLTNLSAARHEWVQDLLRYRKMTKVLTTYLRKFPLLIRDVEPVDSPDGYENDADVPAIGRIFGRFNQTGTVTGRLSSSQPNLQNIPAHGELGPRVRNLFQYPTGMVVGDYSQLEPRLMGHFSQDPVLLDTYRNDRDIYLVTAAGVFGGTFDKHSTERSICKTLILALGYGAGPAKLAQILTINGHPTDERTARDYLRELQSLYQVFFRWREAVIARAKRQGYVQTIGGAHRRLAAQFKQTTWKARGYGERQSVNAIIQGSAGDIVRRTMVRGNWQAEMALIAQVHDELAWLWDAYYKPSDEQLAYVQHQGETVHGFELSVPLKFEPAFGYSWYEAKEGSTFVLPEDMSSDFEDADAELEEA